MASANSDGQQQSGGEYSDKIEEQGVDLQERSEEMVEQPVNLGEVQYPRG